MLQYFQNTFQYGTVGAVAKRLASCATYLAFDPRSEQYLYGVQVVSTGLARN